MELITFSNFEKIANTFTVSDIADSNGIFHKKSNEIVDEIDFVSKGHGDFPQVNHGIFLIEEENEIVGIFTHKSGDSRFIIDDEGTIHNTWAQLMEPLLPNMLISGDTPLIDILILFQRKDDFYLVLNGNKITHSICYYDLDCNEVKISIFALILELDNLLTELVIRLKLNITDYLTEERVRKINKISSEDKFKRFKNSIYYTNFRDKFKILSETFRSIEINKKEVRKFVQKLTEVRNKIAHGESIIGYTYWEVIHKKDKHGKALKFLPIRVLQEKILFEPTDMKQFIQILRLFINIVRTKLEVSTE